jgi:hypothetical protein
MDSASTPSALAEPATKGPAATHCVGATQGAAQATVEEREIVRCPDARMPS